MNDRSTSIYGPVGLLWDDLVRRGEPVLPDHITPDQIEDMAQKYWRSISDVNWSALEFETRKRVITMCQHHLALTWAAKEAGIG